VTGRWADFSEMTLLERLSFRRVEGCASFVSGSDCRSLFQREVVSMRFGRVVALGVDIKFLLSPCQGMGRRTRVVIEYMKEKAAYIPGVRGLRRDA
jgi:hypothetical protein